MSFTAFAWVSRVQTIRRWENVGTPEGFEGLTHLRSSIIPGSAARIRVRIRATVAGRQSPPVRAVFAAVCFAGFLTIFFAVLFAPFLTDFGPGFFAPDFFFVEAMAARVGGVAPRRAVAERPRFFWRRRTLTRGSPSWNERSNRPRFASSSSVQGDAAVDLRELGVQVRGLEPLTPTLRTSFGQSIDQHVRVNVTRSDTNCTS